MSRHDEDTQSNDIDGGGPGVGAAYAVGQWAKALYAHRNHPEPAVRARAAARVARWQQVLAQMREGTARYGSRTPLADIPVWVTLEVATGGFATGALLAGGALSEDEQRLAASLPGIRAGSERLDLNLWHLTEAGIASLQERLARGDYRIDLPEEAALPVVAWLLTQGRTEDASALLDTILPFFDRLRFFPPPADGLPGSATEVHLFDVRDVIASLSALGPHRALSVQTHAIESLLPLYDAAIALWLTTWEDDRPCRHWPEDWRLRAQALCARYEAALLAAPWGMKPKQRQRELYALLAQCARDPLSLQPKQIARIGTIVDDFVRKHGHPESKTHRNARDAQRRQVAAPMHYLYGAAIAARLQEYPADAGIADFGPLLAPISEAEAAGLGLRAGDAIPPAIARRAERCRSGTIADLIECGLVTSADSVALLIPALTAEIRGAGFADGSLRGLYAATYRAFRRRRSLLLLDLQTQAKIGELPWISIVESERRTSAEHASSARQALVESALLVLSAFPQAIVPNKLIREFRALAATAKLTLPLVEEVATDIFMGEFSDRFIAAARFAAGALHDTLYARYYAIHTHELAALPDRGPPPSRSRCSRTPAPRDALAALCSRRAGTPLGTWHPASNGTIIEQQQILTSQNLAPLLIGLDLRAVLDPRLGDMALRCFRWICARQQMKVHSRHSELVMLKNTAYAWRQMLFFLSLQPPAAQSQAIGEIEAHFADQPRPFRARFEPVMLGLRLSAAGGTLPQHGTTPDGARVFLGRTVEPHWLATGN